jgi:tRNA1(Val) A37 N6-methylase TrmN6
VAANNQPVTRGFDVGDRIADLVAGLVVLRLAAAQDDLQHSRIAGIELQNTDARHSRIR